MPIERETIVTTGGGSIGNGLLIGLAIVILVVVVVGFMAVQTGGFSFGGTETTVKIDVPKVTITP